MKSLCFMAVSSILLPLCSSIFNDLHFLKDFFKNRNAVFTINSCWNKNKFKVFTDEMTKFPNFISTGFFSDSKQVNVIKNWDTNVFLIIDFRNCKRSGIILDKINQTNVFAYAVKYLLLVDKIDFPTFSLRLENYQILPNCEMIIAVFAGASAILYEPYKVGKINELTWENYGNWSSDEGLFEYYSNRPTSQRRMNLKGANLVVGVVLFDNDTWNHLTDYMYPGIDTFTKQDFEPTMCMLQHLRANYSFNIVDNYGYINPKTGLFSGLVREVQTGRADVSAGSIFFTRERYGAVDLLKQGNPHPIRFIVKKPSTSYIKNIYFITFNDSVWIAAVVILVIFAPFIIIILNWETKNKKTLSRLFDGSWILRLFDADFPVSQKVKQNKYNVSDVTLITLEAVCQQGTTTEPQSFAGRIVALILFGAFMFIYVSYSANIVVLLQSTTKINSIQELLDSRIEAGGEEIHYMKNYFEAVTKGPLRALYLEKIYPDQYFLLEDGMKKVQEGNFAFHVSLQSAYEYILQHFTNYEICGLQELPGYIEENLGYTAVPKHSSYKDLFKVALLKVDEYGLQRRTNLRILMTTKCFSQSATFKSVGFYDCEQVLWIFIGGIGLSIFVLLAEKLLYYIKNANKIEDKPQLFKEIVKKI